MRPATDISIDLETLSLRYDACIVSIGAVEFNAETGHIGSEFYRSILVESDPQGHVSEDTKAWWQRQGREAMAVLNDPLADSAEKALREFYWWAYGRAKKPDLRAWGNGSIFDIVILENALARFEFAPPWSFWNVRDVRTIVDAAGLDKDAVPFVGVPHFALDDAIHQAKLVIESARRIKR